MGTLRYNTWQNPDGTENYKCRAWVHFNGTGTVAIRASGNVSSITDNGTGLYTVNFNTALADTNYAVVATVGMSNDGSGTTAGFACNGSANGSHFQSNTTTSARIVTAFATSSQFDYSSVAVAIFR